ncbi:MAG: bifunctional phosphopantothenoylcysteine decarboxylase/phosphopantothenate--cysteine ligase CoaBC [Acidobacteriota bacterium]
MRVLVGATGGIAAFKAAHLVRRLRERGHEVRCILTRSAESFVTPLSLEVLSGHTVYREEYLHPGNGGVELHIEVAQWAELLCIAPATANVLGRLALGLADDFLTTTALAFDGPLVIAPAMHSAMWAKAAVESNVDSLRRRGAVFVGPLEGRLASGESGLGRMAEPEQIVAVLEDEFARSTANSSKDGADLSGRTVLITAGPTHEPLDPVRYLGNRSSGKMGFALAAEAARLGARVILVAGPVALPSPAGVERIDVETALEMESVVHTHAPSADLIVMAAAVADFRPTQVGRTKIKRDLGVPHLELTANPDILAGLAEKAPAALRVGFAAETDNLEENAAAKLERKRADFLVANDVSRADIGFGSDANEVTVYRRGEAPIHLSRRAKDRIAAELIHLFAVALSQRDAQPAAR